MTNETQAESIISPQYNQELPSDCSDVTSTLIRALDNINDSQDYDLRDKILMAIATIDACDLYCRQVNIQTINKKEALVDFIFGAIVH